MVDAKDVKACGVYSKQLYLFNILLLGIIFGVIHSRFDSCFTIYNPF